MNDQTLSSDRTSAHLVALFFDLGDTIMVEESEIERRLQAAGDTLAETCRTMVERANEAGGYDNITLILLRVAP